MALGLLLYNLITRLIEPFIGLILKFRVASKKEDPNRRNERLAKNLVSRPDGNLLWIHSASVGESIVALEVIRRVRNVFPENLVILHTSQTVTSAKVIDDQKMPDTIHQMAPFDTPNISTRFVKHWKPNLLVLVEGEIWPNLLMRARKFGTKSILINGRMTEKSLRGWRKWRKMARLTFGGFDEIICSDEVTYSGLQQFANGSIRHVANLKSSLPPLAVDELILDRLKSTFIGKRKCIVATSTHPGEEELILEVYKSLSPRPALIIAPRHPERGFQISKLVEGLGFDAQRYSTDKKLSQSTEILIADTLGDLGLWYRLGDAIYLGGASRPGIGGHNPFEPIRLGKAVITGEHGFNFEEDFNRLSKFGALTFATDKVGLTRAIDTHLKGVLNRIDKQAVAEYLDESEEPLEISIELIAKHLGLLFVR